LAPYFYLNIDFLIILSKTLIYRINLHFLKCEHGVKIKVLFLYFEI
jgi:hypothetical protein